MCYGRVPLFERWQALLLDGGYVNNLPADVMRNVMGAETILAVDVGSQDDMDLTNYGDCLSRWWLFWRRWNPFAKPVKVPNLEEIQSRLAYVSCVRQLEEVKRSDYCTYIRPPIDCYKTLQFGAFETIMNAGLVYGRTLFTGMSEKRMSEMTPHLLLQEEGTKKVNVKPSFTDLAEKVCKIQAPKRNMSITQILNMHYSDEEEEEEEEYETDNAATVSEPEALVSGGATDTDEGGKTRSLTRGRKISTNF